MANSKPSLSKCRGKRKKRKKWAYQNLTSYCEIETVLNMISDTNNKQNQQN